MNKKKDKGTTEGGAHSGGKGRGSGGGGDIDGRVEGLKSMPAMIRDLLKKAESKIGEGDMKALGDYVKLVQMLKELEDEEPREIKVTWVEKTPKPDIES